MPEASGSGISVFRRDYDLFVDLSRPVMSRALAQAHLDSLLRGGGFSTAAGQISVAWPGQDEAGLKEWVRAVSAAARAGRHLAVISGGVRAGNEVAPPMLDALSVDPLLGTAQPRFADQNTDGILALPGATPADRQRGWTSRQATTLLPPLTITTELLSACLLIRREVVATMEFTHGFGSVQSSLAYALCQARRRGYRNAVVNQVVVALDPDVTPAYPELPEAIWNQLQRHFPDASRAITERANDSQPLLESLLSAAYPDGRKPRRLLLDCRGLAPFYNGTSQCILGMLDGFSRLRTEWRLEVLSSLAAAQFHKLAYRYPAFNQLHDAPVGQFAAVFMLNQPWSVATINELHRHGYLVGFNILDTIAWDILYPAPQDLVWAWRFIARHSDLLTFISRFSQERFRQRFPVSSGVRERAIHLSLLPEDYTRQRFRGISVAEHVLLFGNHYDHKGIQSAIRELTAAFPRQSFVVIGGCEAISPHVRVIPSGHISLEEVHELVASAEAIVFPSFYEGFGLPVVEGLAYGRPVLVRHSELWEEIAASTRLPGALIPFHDADDMIRALGNVLEGSPPPGLPSGTMLSPGSSPIDWTESAARLLDLVEQRLMERDPSHWLARNEAIQWAQS